VFFALCDEDNDGFIDPSKIKHIVELELANKLQELSKQEKDRIIRKKVRSIMKKINAPKSKEISQSDVITACRRTPELIKIFDYYIALPQLYKQKSSTFSISSFIHNQTLLAHEGTHLNYMKQLLPPIREYERIRAENEKMLAEFEQTSKT